VSAIFFCEMLEIVVIHICKNHAKFVNIKVSYAVKLILYPS